VDWPWHTRQRLLVHRHHWNPQVYRRFRPAFNRAGLEFAAPDADDTATDPAPGRSATGLARQVARSIVNTA
jgi:hypothetical protein